MALALLWLGLAQPDPTRESLAPRATVTEQKDAWRLAGQWTGMPARSW